MNMQRAIGKPSHAKNQTNLLQEIWSRSVRSVAFRLCEPFAFSPAWHCLAFFYFATKDIASLNVAAPRLVPKPDPQQWTYRFAFHCPSNHSLEKDVYNAVNCPGDGRDKSASAPKHLVWKSGCNYRYSSVGDTAQTNPSWVAGAVAVIVLSAFWLLVLLVWGFTGAWCRTSGAETRELRGSPDDIEGLEEDGCTSCEEYERILPSNGDSGYFCFSKCVTHVCSLGLMNVVFCASMVAVYLGMMHTHPMWMCFPRGDKSVLPEPFGDFDALTQPCTMHLDTEAKYTWALSVQTGCSNVNVELNDRDAILSVYALEPSDKVLTEIQTYQARAGVLLLVGIVLTGSSFLLINPCCFCHCCSPNRRGSDSMCSKCSKCGCRAPVPGSTDALYQKVADFPETAHKPTSTQASINSTSPAQVKTAAASVYPSVGVGVGNTSSKA